MSDECPRCGAIGGFGCYECVPEAKETASDVLVKRLRKGDTPMANHYMDEAADRIEELEAKLAEYKHVSSAIDTQWAESQDQIAELKAKLEKAEWMLVEATVQLREGKAKTRRNRAHLIDIFLEELKNTPPADS